MTDNPHDAMRHKVAKDVREAVEIFNAAMKNANSLNLKIDIRFAKEHESEDVYGGLVIRKIWWTETTTVEYTV